MQKRFAFIAMLAVTLMAITVIGCFADDADATAPYSGDNIKFTGVIVNEGEVINDQTKVYIIVAYNNGSEWIYEAATDVKSAQLANISSVNKWNFKIEVGLLNAASPQTYHYFICTVDKYKIATISDSLAPEDTYTIKPGTSVTNGLVFDNAFMILDSEWASASSDTTVEITSDSMVQNCITTMPSKTSVTITAVDGGNLPLTGVTIRFFTDAAKTNLAYSAITDVSGGITNAVINGVVTGDYYIDISAESYEKINESFRFNGNAVSFSEPIHITRGVSDSVEIQLKPVSQINTITFRGIIVYTDGAPLNNSEGSVFILKAGKSADINHNVKYYETLAQMGNPSCSISLTTVDNHTWNFSITVQRIDDEDTRDYYICIQNGYKLLTVNSNFENQTFTLKPASSAVGSAYYYNSYRIKESVWSSHTGNDPIYLTSYDQTQLSNCLTTVDSITTLSGKISYDTTKLSGATISLYNPTTGSLRYVAISHEGTFAFDDILTGVYTIKVELVGYKVGSMTIGINQEPVEGNTIHLMDNERNTLVINMEENKGTSYLGYDLPHFLMILGGVMGGIIFIASALFQIRVTRGKKENWILNDIDESDEDKKE